MPVLPLLLLMLAADAKTTVAPLPGEQIRNPCEYRMFVPPVSQPLKAAWVIWDRGMDYLNWYQDPEVRHLAAEHRLALVLPAHCSAIERDDMIVIPEKGVGRAILTAMDQFADAEHRPELKMVPLLHMGWSGAGSLAARMAAYHPERYLAGVLYAPGQYDPLGMDTIELKPQDWRAPQLIIANGADNTNGTSRPYAYFERYFRQGAPWTFAVQNATPHCCLQNAKPLIMEWVRQVVSHTEPAQKHFGYLTPQPTAVVDEWKIPVVAVANPRVQAKRAAPRPGEMLGGWLPGAQFQRLWLEFERRAQPPQIWKP